MSNSTTQRSSSTAKTDDQSKPTVGDGDASAKMHEEVLAVIREQLMAMAGKNKSSSSSSTAAPAGHVAAAIGRLSDSTKV